MPNEIDSTKPIVPAQPLNHRVSNVDEFSDNDNAVYHIIVGIYLIRYVYNGYIIFILQRYLYVNCNR